MSEKKYKISVEAKILELLGPNLYTNVYYVLGELIANAYDADAKNVYIIINEKSLTIEDDGNGMSYSNSEVDNFLKVASESSKKSTTKLGRTRMGRKGIGKLAALAVSEKVLIKTISNGEKSGFILSRYIPKDGYLEGLKDSEITFHNLKSNHGTSITMNNPQYKLHKTEIAIRKRLLNIFPFISSDFRIHVKGNELNFVIDNFEYEKMKELDGLITIGEEFKDLHDYLNLKYKNENFYKILPEDKILINEELNLEDIKIENTDEWRDFYNKEVVIKGWMGVYKTTAGKTNKVNDFPENHISLYANGKLGYYNLLPEISKNRIDEAYIVGQIHVDIFEDKNLPDMSLSNRQGYKSDDIRYEIVINRIRDKYLEEAIKIRKNISAEIKKEKQSKDLAAQVQSEESLAKKTEEFREKTKKKISAEIMEKFNKKEIDKQHLEEIIIENVDTGLQEIIKLKNKTDQQRKKILISHTQLDKKFADIIYKMLVFNNIPKECVIYSSSDDVEAKIPYGNNQIDNLYDYLRKFFIQSYSAEKIYIAFVTSKNTRESWGTLVEVGATWIVQSDHCIFSLNDFIPKEPLNNKSYHTSYLTEDQMIYILEKDTLQFIVQLEEVCKQTGHKPNTREENFKYLRSLLSIEKIKL